MKAPKVLGIVKLATERRVTIGMLTLAVIVFGFVSLSRLKLNLLPELSYPSLTPWRLSESIVILLLSNYNQTK